MRFGLLCLLAAIGLSGCGNIALSVPKASPSAPKVNNVAPAASATGVPVNAAITANFSQAMSTSSLTTTTFTLTDSNSTTVPGAVNFSASGTAATFNPYASLAYNTQYTDHFNRPLRCFALQVGLYDRCGPCSRRH